MQTEETLEMQQKRDEKAARMLEIYANQSFNSVQSAQRMRLRLVVWAMRNKIQVNLKRIVDLIIAIIMLILTSPIMLGTAVAIKLSSPGPVLFHQKRVGKWGDTFSCYKFRSMYIDAEARKAELMDQNEADEVVFKMKNDPRVTGVGRIIRKLSIDELPQLFNVIKGEMSMVGPRPPVPNEVSQYEFEHMRRLGAMPGITGLQQVTARTMPFKRWVELDLEYIAEQSLAKDIEILARTIPAVLFSKDAY